MKQQTWSIMDLIRRTADFFAYKGIPSPRLDAELLLGYVLGIERIQLYMHFDRPLNTQELNQYRELVRRRAKREPMAYILGEKEFWSLKFKVTRHVLIPRPETEILLEAALDLCRDLPGKITRPLILDLCTGSGNLVVSLAKELEHAQLAASDLSLEALYIARENAMTHEVFDRITWYHGDLFDCLEEIQGKVDLLLSNPPYIAEGELTRLEPEIHKFEPRQALAAGDDGLDVYRKIAAQAGEWIKPGGFLCLEIGAKQAEAVSGLLRESKNFGKILVLKDYAGQNRVVTAQAASRR